MASINKVILLGNVGKEHEVRYVEKGLCVASLRVATQERGYELPGGTRVPDRADWHNVVVWRQLAEFAEKYIHTGDLVYVEGKIKTRSYEDKKGITRYVTEVWGSELQLVGSRNPLPQQVAEGVVTSPQSPES